MYVVRAPSRTTTRVSDDHPACFALLSLEVTNQPPSNDFDPPYWVSVEAPSSLLGTVGRACGMLANEPPNPSVLLIARSHSRSAQETLCCRRRSIIAQADSISLSDRITGLPAVSA